MATWFLLMGKCAPVSIKRTMLHVAAIYCISLMLFSRGICTFHPVWNYVEVELQSYLVPGSEFNSINFHPPPLHIDFIGGHKIIILPVIKDSPRS